MKSRTILFIFFYLTSKAVSSTLNFQQNLTLPDFYLANPHGTKSNKTLKIDKSNIRMQCIVSRQQEIKSGKIDLYTVVYLTYFFDEDMYLFQNSKIEASNKYIMPNDLIRFTGPENPLRIPIWVGDKTLADEMKDTESITEKLNIVAREMKANPDNYPEFEGLHLEKLAVSLFDEDLSVVLGDVHDIVFSNHEVSRSSPIDDLFKKINKFDDVKTEEETKEKILGFLDFKLFENKLLNYLKNVKDLVNREEDIKQIKQVIAEKEASIKDKISDTTIDFFSEFNKNRQHLIQTFFEKREKAGINFIFCMVHCLLNTYPFKYPRHRKFDTPVIKLAQDWLNLAIKDQELIESVDSIKGLFNLIIHGLVKMGRKIENIFDANSPDYAVIQEAVVTSVLSFAKQIKGKILFELLKLTTKEKNDVEGKLVAYLKSTNDLKSTVNFMAIKSVVLQNIVKFLKYMGMVPENLIGDHFVPVNWLKMNNSELKNDINDFLI